MFIADNSVIIKPNSVINYGRIINVVTEIFDWLA